MSEAEVTLAEAFALAEEANLFDNFALFKSEDGKWAVCDRVLWDWDFYVLGRSPAEAIHHAVQYVHARKTNWREAFSLLGRWKSEAYGEVNP